MRTSLHRILAITLILGAILPISPSRPALADDPEISSPDCQSSVAAILSGLNVVAAGDVTVTRTAVTGRVVASGDANLDSWSVGGALAIDSARYDLQVDGSIFAANGQVPKGSISYGVTASSTLWAPNGQIVQRPAEPNPIELVDEVRAVAGAAAEHPVNATYANVNPWWTTLQFEGSHDDLNVFRIDSSVLSTAKGIRVKVPQGATALIVVDGSSFSTAVGPLASVQLWNGSSFNQAQNPGSAATQDQRRRLVWVFPDATTVQIGPNLAWEGSVLAPGADITVTASTDLRGAVVGQTTLIAGSVSNFPIAADACLPATSQVQLDCAGLAATVIGTDGDDDLIGTEGDDVIYGGAGNDVIDGGAGNDVICGSSGNDTLLGGSGVDQLVGGDGDDFLDGGAGSDALDGGEGTDDCTAGPSNVNCEVDSRQADAASFDDFLAELPTAQPQQIDVSGFDGVRASVETAGGIRPIDIDIATDYQALERVVGLAASPVYDFEVIADAPPIISATITIPYDPQRLGAAGELVNSDSWPAGLPKIPIDENDLRIHWFDPALGLWVDAGPDQIIDADNNTITVTVDHFSRYAVLAQPQSVLAPLPLRPPTCVPEAGPVPADVVIAIDQSFAAHLADPEGRRIADARSLTQLLQLSDSDTTVGVIGYDSSAAVYLDVTRIGTGADVRTAISAADRVGTREPDIAQALISAQRLLGERVAGRQQHIVLFTSGHTSGWTYFPWSSSEVLEENTFVHAIRPTDAGNERAYIDGNADDMDEVLEDLTSETGGTLSTGGGSGSQDLVELISSDRDRDDDGLADCVEIDGFVTSQSIMRLADPGATRSEAGETFDIVFIRTDPDKPDTDDDLLADGAELGAYIDLYAIYEAACFGPAPSVSTACGTYEQYIDLGIYGYYLATSYPDEPDSDFDGVDDKAELDGYTVVRIRGRYPNISVVTYESFTDPLDRDTDDDGLNDGAERANEMRGDEPDISELDELGLIDDGDGVEPFMLFQPEHYSEQSPDDEFTYGKTPVVELAFFYPYRAGSEDATTAVTYTNVWNPDVVLSYDTGFDCLYSDDETGLCRLIVDAAFADVPSTLDCVWFGCDDEFTRVHKSIKRIVDRQGVFDDAGNLRDEYVYFLSLYECRDAGYDAEACDELDSPDIDGGISLAELATILVQQLMDRPGGYRPRDNCPDPNAIGGIYDIVEKATRNVVYVGRTQSFRIRGIAHAAGRFPTSTYELVPVTQFRTNDRIMQRVLEQRRFDELWGDVDINFARSPANYPAPNEAASQNLRRPMSQTNWNKTAKSGKTPKGLAGEFGQGC